MDDPILVKFGGWLLAGLAGVVAFFSRRQLFEIQSGIEKNHEAIVEMNEKLGRLDERVKSMGERVKNLEDRG